MRSQNNNNKDWYVLQTKPKKEESVYKLLTGGGFNTFFPKIKSFASGRGKNNVSLLAESIKPLFPSYLFIRLNLANYEELKMVRYTRGVSKIIGGYDGPIPITEDVVSIIRSRIGEKGYIEQGSFLKVGDRVVVKRGLLKDLVGIMEKPVDDRGRVEILFRIVHHQMRAKVYCADLEKM